MGSLKSPYITQYIENVLEPLGFDIYMQVPNEDKIYASEFLTKHKINYIKHHSKSEGIIYRVPILGLILQRLYNLFAIIKIKPFDFIHLQFVTMNELIRMVIARSKKTKCFASFWGSDLLRVDEKKLKKEQKFLDRLDFISSDSYLVKKRYHEIYPTAKNDLEVIYYGLTFIDVINKFANDIKGCKKYFDFPVNKKIVAIGYNAIKQQQHDRVLSALSNIPNKKDYFLVFQMTYGAISDKNYQENLVKQIEDSGFEYKIFSSYLSIDDLAKLRIATDIFINAQTTDAFCNTIKEHMCAKTLIISATWLNYLELKMFPLYVNEFSDFDQIPSLMEKPISKEKLEWNKKTIEEKTTWTTCLNRWAEIYGVKQKEGK